MTTDRGDSRGGRADDRLEDDVAAVLGEYIDRLIAGEILDRTVVLKEHPDLADELLRRLDLFREVGADATEEVGLGSLGDYTLRRQIGRGGMGVVYDAWQGAVERRVALKVLPGRISADDRTFQRFMREARTAARLNHPNVVHVYGMGVEDHTAYYAMEYVEGQTLAEVLASTEDAESGSETVFGRMGSLAYYSRVAEAFADVADGLQHAHARGVVHRDIKPSNLIFSHSPAGNPVGGADRAMAAHRLPCRERRLRILDFGLARVEGQDSLTLSGDVLGTPLYMSPEQARQRKVPIDYRTDIYSLGATMYETVTGQPPFRGKDHADTLSQIIDRDPIEPRKLNSRVPKQLETIVLKCLRKDPADRYGTAEALGQDLRRFVRGDPVEARPRARWERLLRRAGRHRLTISAVVVVLVSLAVAAQLLYRQHRAGRIRRYENGVRSAAADIEFYRSISGRFLGESVLSQASELFRGPGLPDLVPATVTAELLETVEDLRGFVLLFPGRPEARYHLASALYLAGRENLAAREIERLIQRRPDFAPARVLQARIAGGGDENPPPVFSDRGSREMEVWTRHWIRAHDALRRRDGSAAREALDRALSCFGFDSPPYPGFFLEGLKLRGVVRLREGDTYGALEDFVAVRTLWPESPESTLLAAMAYLDLGERERATAALENLFESVAHTRPELATCVALICLNLDREQAERWYERIPDDFQRERTRAHVLLMHFQFDEAMAAARRALDLRPEDVTVRTYLADALVHSGRPDRAHEILAPILQTVSDYRAWTIMGFAQTRLERYADAERCFLRALDLRPLDVRATIQLGDVYLFRGEPDLALSPYREALENNPRSAHGWMILGFALHVLGEEREAKSALRRAHEILPGHSVVSAFQAMVAATEGRVADAIESLTTAAELGLDETGWSGWALEKLGPIFEIPLTGQDAQRRVELFGRLETVAAGGFGDLALLDCLARGWLASDATRAICFAQEAVERSERSRPGFLSTLARAQTRSGHGELAVQTLEEAARLPAASRRIARELEESRRAILPRLVSFASTDWALATTDRDDLVPGGPGIARYLEACRLLRSGKPEAATPILEALAKSVADDPAPVLRLAECRLTSGGAVDGIEGLRRALAGEASRHREVWEAWLTGSFVALGQSPRALLEVFPGYPGENDPGAEHRESYHWLLERLRDRRSIPIASGAAEDLTLAGALWSRDRFYLSGRRSQRVPVEIVGTDVDQLIQTSREFVGGAAARPGYRFPLPGPFDRTGAGPELPSRACGYRIPLPTGRYEVKLHFAALDWDDRGRSFDLTLEGRVREREHRPAAGGMDRAVVRSFSIDVEDGALDIEFIPREGAPKVAAVEVHW